jgi:hypothetical protein
MLRIKFIFQRLNLYICNYYCTRVIIVHPSLAWTPLFSKSGSIFIVPWRRSQPEAAKCSHLYKTTFQICILTRWSASLTQATSESTELHCHLNWWMACPVPELMSLHRSHFLVPLRRSRTQTFHQVKPAVKSPRMGRQFKCADRLVRGRGVQILCSIVSKNVCMLNVNRMTLNVCINEYNKILCKFLTTGYATEHIITT